MLSHLRDVERERTTTVISPAFSHARQINRGTSSSPHSRDAQKHTDSHVHRRALSFPCERRSHRRISFGGPLHGSPRLAPKPLLANPVCRAAVAPQTRAGRRGRPVPCGHARKILGRL